MQSAVSTAEINPNENNLAVFIKGATKLPTLPTLIARLLSTMNNPSQSANDVARLIISDTTMSAKVLKMANSVFYTRRGKVSTVSQAIVRLGFKTIQSLVLTIWTQTLRSFAHSQEELQLLTRILDHGTACAVTTNLLIRDIDRTITEDSFIAGLLHDIGRVALVCQLGKIYKNDILDPAEEEQSSIVDLEQKVLGFDHGLLGAELMRSWNLPSLFTETALHHHDEEINPKQNPVLAAVCLADSLVTQINHNVAMNSLRPNRENLLEFFKISDAEIFLADCKSKIAILEASLR